MAQFSMILVQHVGCLATPTINMAASTPVPPPPLSPLISDISFPEALLQPAKCLVTLTGLDIRNNAVHMAIWDLFKAGRRGERKPVSYRNVTADHLYPKKRVVSEEYIHLVHLYLLVISYLKTVNH